MLQDQALTDKNKEGKIVFENQLILSMLSEMQEHRKECLDLREGLANETDHNRVLQLRLVNVKEKYSSIKKQRNDSYARIKELNSDNRMLAAKVAKLQLQIDELK